MDTVGGGRCPRRWGIQSLEIGATRRARTYAKVNCELCTDWRSVSGSETRLVVLTLSNPL